MPIAMPSDHKMFCTAGHNSCHLRLWCRHLCLHWAPSTSGILLPCLCMHYMCLPWMSSIRVLAPPAVMLLACVATTPQSTLPAMKGSVLTAWLPLQQSRSCGHTACTGTAARCRASRGVLGQGMQVVQWQWDSACRAVSGACMSCTVLSELRVC